MTVIFTTQARAQIRAIRAYSHRHFGATTADLYANALRTTMQDILDPNPALGRDRSADIGPGVLSFPANSHLIFYRVVKVGIEILAVVHQKDEPTKYSP
ncbi:type II toxin-antitoxin system RelE/ParE family toxin [Erwinia billingiae]|jgi:toxin ParE1/3/4|nr:type II toxin-antitoxin system RelE/ParE family toxin [Erwinia billingiae]QEW33740.1 type II toxin-antitoxin system RelE/ParE family toxin [Erwinia billingiae]